MTTARRLRRAANWIGARQQDISDRAHWETDMYAAYQEWTITKSTGRFGFGARTYRDPRFNRRAQSTTSMSRPERTRT